MPRRKTLRLSIAPHGRRSLPAQEAFPAIYWPPLGWLKWHRGFPAALRAGGHGFRFGKARGRRTRAFGLTVLAPLGFVLEVFVVEEVLFSRCEYEVCSAVYALEDAVLKIRHINCAPLSTCTVLVSDLMPGSGRKFLRPSAPGIRFIQSPGDSSSGFVCGPALAWPVASHPVSSKRSAS